MLWRIQFLAQTEPRRIEYPSCLGIGWGVEGTFGFVAAQRRGSAACGAPAERVSPATAC
jgi:hypothetical protein